MALSDDDVMDEDQRKALGKFVRNAADVLESTGSDLPTHTDSGVIGEVIESMRRNADDFEADEEMTMGKFRYVTAMLGATMLTYSGNLEGATQGKVIKRKTGSKANPYELKF